MEQIELRVVIHDSKKHKVVLSSLPLPLNRAAAFATLCRSSLPIEMVITFEEVRYDD